MLRIPRAQDPNHRILVASIHRHSFLHIFTNPRSPCSRRGRRGSGRRSRTGRSSRGGLRAGAALPRCRGLPEEHDSITARRRRPENRENCRVLHSPVRSRRPTSFRRSVRRPGASAYLSESYTAVVRLGRHFGAAPIGDAHSAKTTESRAAGSRLGKVEVQPFNSEQCTSSFHCDLTLSGSRRVKLNHTIRVNRGRLSRNASMGHWNDSHSLASSHWNDSQSPARVIGMTANHRAQ
jgi:hypothetical protein